MVSCLQYLCFLVAVCWGLQATPAEAQTFSLRSFDGRTHRLRLLPPDEAHDRVAVVCSADTFYAHNALNVKNAQVLGDRFLLVAYTVRSGVGMHAERNVLLSVDHDTLCTSLNILSRFQEEVMDFSQRTRPSVKVSERSTYAVQLSLTSTHSRGYQLLATVHDERQSTSDPTRNHRRDFTTTLPFAPRQYLFSSSQLTKQ